VTPLGDASRREFLKAGAALGGGLVLGVALPSRGSAAAPSAMPNAWVRIGSDDSVTILCARSEMGQGVYTAMPTLVAEELEVDLDRIKVEIAPVGEPYVNSLLGAQLTGGSTSVIEGYDKLRLAGAQARTMLVTAAAQRWGADPSACRAEHGAVLGPNGVRATYGEVAEAAAKLPVPESPRLKEHQASRYVGKPVNRLDSAAKIDGSAVFGIDVKLPSMLYAALAQCPVIGGKVASFDAAKAKAMPGVKHVVQVSDGVAVVADSWWRAKVARDALSVQWDEGGGRALDTSGIAAGLKAASAKPGAVIKKLGDVDAALQGAAKTLRAEYELPFLAHAPMEPMNFTADVRKDSCLLVGPTQGQQLAAAVAAQACGLAPEQVTVRTTFLGGGFGRRIDVDFISQAVEISRAIGGGPVKLVWTREDDMTHDFYRPMSFHQLSGALDAAGRPVALKFHLVSSSVTSRLFPVFVKDGIDPFMVEAAAVPYDIPHQLADVVIHDTGLRVGYWRSVSHALNAFAYESFMDELAAAAGKDPYELRRGLLDRHPRLRRVLDVAAEKSGWGKPLPDGRTRGIALMEGYGTSMAQVAEVSVAGSRIRVHRIVVAADLGRIVNPNIVRQQLESSINYGVSALVNEITLKDGRVEQTNFHDYPVLRMSESPSIEMHVVASDEKPAGIGEPGTALVGPAVANAVFAATGKRLRRMPLRLA
jgi:isoquinoline 1-oxidoreductase beta subunit